MEPYKIEILIAEKIFQFICDHDAQIAHVKEALFQFMKHVGHIEDNVRAQEKQRAEESQQPVQEESTKHEDECHQ